MQASISTSTIAKFSRSFNIDHTTPGREENAKEKVTYSEFQAFGEPFACLGTVGDIYVDITNKNCALYARFERGWKKWPGPTQRTTPLHHPVHLTHVLWCKLDKKVLGWIPVKFLSRVLISSSSHVISTILDSRRRALQKHVKKQSKTHTLPPPTKKPRLDEPSAPSAQSDSLTDPVRINYCFSFPPFLDSVVTFMDKSAFPTMDSCASDSKPQSDAQHNATRQARRSSKLMLPQNMQSNGLPELDDDFMAESQRLMNAIMGSTKGCPADAAVAEPPMHETQLQNPPLEEPPAPRVPSPSYPQTQAQRSNSSGSSSTLSESGPADPEPQRIPTTSGTQFSTKLPDSPIPEVMKLRISPVSRKRSSWAMLENDEAFRAGASSSALQIKPTHELEHSSTTSSFPISTYEPFKKRISTARKVPSPSELHGSFGSSPSPKVKGKAKAPDASSNPISAKKEQLSSAVIVEEAKVVANQVLSSGSGLVPPIFDDMQPESPPAPQEQQTMSTSSSSDGWKQLQRLPSSRLNSPSASSSTSISPSRFAVQNSKSDQMGAASKHVRLGSVQKPAPVNSLDASASPSSSSKKSPARREKAIDDGAVTNIQVVRKRSPPPMDVEGVDETDNGRLTLGGDLPLLIDDESHHPNSRSSSPLPNVKLKKGTSSPSPVAWPLETKKSQKGATSVSAPVTLSNTRLGKGLASVSARSYPKRSRVVADKGVLDLTGVDSDDDDMIEIAAARKVKKYSSVILSPTKFKVKGRDPPMFSSKKQLKVMPKYKHHPDYKRKATVDREAKAKQQLKNELNKESVIDLTLASDEDEDNQIDVKPLLLAKRAVPCRDEVEQQIVGVVKEEEEEDMFGDIEMVDLTAPSRNIVEEIDSGLGGDVDMSKYDDINDGKGLEGDEVNKDEDDKNDSGDEDRGLPIGSEDAEEDGRNHSSREKSVFGGGEGDEGMIKDLVPPLAHLPEPQSDSETGSSHIATEEEVDELKDQDDESELEHEDGEDLRDIPNLQLTNVHLQMLFDLDGKRYCRACLSHEPTVYWQVPPGSVDRVSEQLMQHCISMHLEICEQFAALDHDELKEIERTVM